MRLVSVRHVTTYRYASPVVLGEHRMMFRPRDSHDLHLVNTKLVIAPRPTAIRWLHDAFDNSVALATFGEAASELRFESAITLEHFESGWPEFPLEVYAQSYPFSYASHELPDLAGSIERQYPDRQIDAWARQFLATAGPTDTMGMLLAMTQAINARFAYVRRDEMGVQRPTETLQRRSGSCRDFALLMMDAVRSLGLAARFVSGYIYVPSGLRVAIARANRPMRRGILAALRDGCALRTLTPVTCRSRHQQFP
jgi:transglutaminase-like putative cysteine protease